jgi:hypothetical protein
VVRVTSSAEAFGAVGSPNPKCLANRTVEIYAVRASGPRLFDVDKTSRKGFWSGGGENLTQAASAVRVKVLAKNIGPKGGAHVCKAAATSRPLA